MNILIIKLGAIGDVLRTTALLPALREKYPGCRLEWVTAKDSLDILKNNKLIDKVHLISRKEELKGASFDLIISLDDDKEGCALASSLSSKKIVGAYLEGNRRTYTDDAAAWFDLGLISKLGKEKADKLKALNKKTYQEILFGMLGINGGKYKKHRPILNLQKKEAEFAERFARKHNIKKDDLVIGVNTGAGGRWKDKSMPISKTIKLIDALNESLECKVVLFGGPNERERNEKIKRGLKTEVVDAGCDNSLMEFAALINLCSILVTSDSLALHIGVALGKKVVAFFGPTSAAEIMLYGRGRKIVPKRGCLCCYREKCAIPPDYNVTEILNAVKELAK
jgi:heptosyltransferase-2